MHQRQTYFIVIALGIILCLLSLVHLIVYEGIVLVFSLTNSHFLAFFRILFIVLALSFVVTSVVSAKYNNYFTRALYRLSAAWTGFLLYFFLAAFIYIVYLLIGPPLIFFGLILFGAAFLTGLYGIIHSNRIKIKHLTIELAHLPDVWKGRKAVFVSDLHLGQVRGADFSQKVCEEIHKLNPDIVLIGGDMYDGVAVYEQKVIEPFRNLTSRLRMYFVTGNHEEFGDNSKYLKALQAAGIQVLNDEKIEIDGLQVVGVDYKTTNSAQKFKNVLDSIPLDLSKPSILLKHVPLHIEVAAEKGISLQLSGHTHRAQVFPFSLLTPLMFKGFDYGLKKFQRLQVLTSSGVGTWGPPLRVGTDSEIIALTFK